MKLRFDYAKLQAALDAYIEEMEADWGACFHPSYPPESVSTLQLLVLEALGEDGDRYNEPYRTYIHSLNYLNDSFKIAKAMLSDYYSRILRRLDDFDL